MKKPATKKPAKKKAPPRRPKPKPAPAKPPKQVRQKSELPSAKQAAFLAAYAETGNISAAAKLSGTVRQAHYEWMQADPDYPEKFAAAHETACDALETEARRRAVEGVDKPVFYQGFECGTIREYSDTLLIFLMKGARPDKYRDNAKIEHVGPNGGPIAIQAALKNLTDDELEQLESLAKAATQPGRDRS